MLSSKLTKGMTSLEIWIVMLSALANKREMRRLAKYFAERVA